MEKKIKLTISYIILGLLGIIFMFPVVITFTNSLMTRQEIDMKYTSQVTAENHFGTEGNIHFVEMDIVPQKVTFRQYYDLFTGNPAYMGAFFNSAKITVPVVLGQLIIGIVMAYCFENANIRFKEHVFFLYILVMFMPLQVTLVPNYMTVEFLKINGSYLAIILPGIFSPFSVFLFRQYMKGLPKEYIEAARIDGAGHLRIISMIVSPLMKPAVAVMVILTFTSYWNIVEQAIIFIKEAYNEPLSSYLPRMAVENMGMMFAASCFYMLPALIIFIYGRKNMLSGMSQSLKI